MALDQALIESVSNLDSPPIFRVYGWRPEGVSFGFNQKIEDILNLDKCRKENIPYVRRMTGGSIILHKDDISYSLITKRDNLNIKTGVLESYKIINSFLICFYNSLGLEVDYFNNKDSEKDLGICSLFKERYDIIYKGFKMGGNAQRRRGEVVFQHGSIPLKDSNVLQLKRLLKDGSLGSLEKSISLDRALNREIDFKEAESLLISAFKKSFNAEFKGSKLLDIELSNIDYLEKCKYRTDSWNLERRDYAKEAPSLAQ